MASWQSFVLKLYLIVKRRFAGQSREFQVARERADTESMSRMFKPLCTVQCDSVVANGVPGEWVIPQGLQSPHVILFLHGGGFNSGSLVSHRSLAANVALACKARSLLIEYRLAPEHPFPAAVEDAVAAFEWLLTQGYTPGEIVVAGDSAGGTLTLALLLSLRDHHRPLPAAAVCLSPVADLTLSGESWVSNARRDLMVDRNKTHKAMEIYLSGADPHTPLASPLFADLRELPPLLIQVGSHEHLLSDSSRLAQKAKAAGVDVTLEVWPGMQHEWHFAATILPEAKQAISHIGAFVQAAISRAERQGTVHSGKNPVDKAGNA